MEISTLQINEKNLRIHTVEGVIMVPLLVEKLRGYYQSTDFDPGMNSLWDLREADFSSISAKEVRSMMEMVKGHWGKDGKTKSALLVTKDLDFGLARMYEMLMGGATTSSIMVFRNYDDAIKWLEDE